jgi:uncharacterized membrane protein
MNNIENESHKNDNDNDNDKDAKFLQYQEMFHEKRHFDAFYWQEAGLILIVVSLVLSVFFENKSNDNHLLFLFLLLGTILFYLAMLLLMGKHRFYQLGASLKIKTLEEEFKIPLSPIRTEENKKFLEENLKKCTPYISWGRVFDFFYFVMWILFFMLVGFFFWYLYNNLFSLCFK